VSPVKYKLGLYIPEDAILHGDWKFRMLILAAILQSLQEVSGRLFPFKDFHHSPIILLIGVICSEY
jgi:hypothetical protein